MFGNSKTVMIVKGKGREAKYAQLLFQLMAKLPNFESSQPITEAEYAASSLTVDNIPNGKVIFFGNGKEAILQGKAVNWQYNCFGMKYGWLGNRCVITADPNGISLKEQSAFAEYYNAQIAKFRRLRELQSVHYSETETLDISEMEDEAAKTVSTVVLELAKGLRKGASDTFENIRATLEREDLWEHQYELLVCKFILDGYACFMNNNTEKEIGKKAIIVYDTKETEYAHLLNNLIQQHTRYDVAEYTEKMFVDNAKKLSSKNKIIFLGKTKSSRERWLDSNRYVYYENGMRYGWIGNHAFVYVRPLKQAEIKDFIEAYQKKSKEFEDKAKQYSENNGNSIGKNFAKGYHFAIGYATAMFALPVMGVFSTAAEVGIYEICYCVEELIKNKVNTIAELKEYQYQLLLREFVFDGFIKFVEEA